MGGIVVVASEGGSSISQAMSTVVTLANNAMQIITGNEVLMVLFVASLIGVGFGVIRRAKSAARS